MNRKDNTEYQKARENLINILSNEKRTKEAEATIKQLLERYKKYPNARDALNNIKLFKKFYKIDSNNEYSLLKLGLECNFDASTVSRRIDKILDSIIRYDIILQDSKKLLYDLFGVPYEETPANYRF